MGYVCVIAGGKGGVGKTTTAINLAMAAAERHEVALLDADLQMANLGAMLGLDPAGSLHDVLANEAALADVLVDGTEGPAVVVGDRSLDAYAEADPAPLRDVVTDLRADYDLVVVDTGAGLSHDGLVPMDLADGILLVTTPDSVAVRDTAKTADLAERVDGSITGVVVTKATPETDVEGIDADLGYPVVGVVPEDPGVGTGPPILHRSSDAPAAASYRQLAEDIERVVFEGASGTDLTDNWELPASAIEPGASASDSTAEANLSDSDGDSAPSGNATDGETADGEESGTPETGQAAESTAASTGESADPDESDPSAVHEPADGDESGEAADADEAEADESTSGGVFGLFR